MNSRFLVERAEKRLFFVVVAQKQESKFYGVTVKKHIKNLANRVWMLYNKNNVIALAD